MFLSCKVVVALVGYLPDTLHHVGEYALDDSLGVGAVVTGHVGHHVVQRVEFSGGLLCLVLVVAGRLHVLVLVQTILCHNSFSFLF